MKPIKSKAHEEKRRKKNQTIIGIILIFVMFGSVFGIIANNFGGSDLNQKVKYGDYEFVSQNGYWVLNLEGYNFLFKYLPGQTGNVMGFSNTLNNYAGKTLYLSSENQEASSEITNNLIQVVQRMQYACLEGEECEGDFPVKTCNDNFVIIEEKNETEIVQNDGCTFIRGPYENLTLITDEFLYKTIGIKQ